ncbi:hypothetical protein AEGHOMDF_3386 [Methylobacterium soli]|nr:hypothetical protein AEGHOMDF_3386 [Methylobacterium soli]
MRVCVPLRGIAARIGMSPHDGRPGPAAMSLCGRAGTPAAKRMRSGDPGLAGPVKICHLPSLGQHPCPIFGKASRAGKGFRDVNIVASKRDLKPVAIRAIRAHAG